ncbi:MAG: hypothetical protein WEA61_03380 [Anaerolineales bacterium]
MSESVCPSCGATISVKGTPKMRMKVTCKSCDTEVEVVRLDPLELDWPMDEYEDELEEDATYEDGE